MYQCIHFGLPELVYPELYYDYKNADRLDLLWLVFDERVLKIADTLRDTYGPIFVNNWNYDGSLKYCGKRPENCEVGAELSQHKFGRALDLHFTKVDAAKVRKDIMENKVSLPYPISCLEFGISWFHFDVRNNDSDKIIQIYL